VSRHAFDAPAWLDPGSPVVGAVRGAERRARPGAPSRRPEVGGVATGRSMLAPKTDRESGFTLFEVLVALIVLAVAFVATIQLFGGGLRLARASADHVAATLLASGKLSEVPDEAVEEGEEEGTEGEYHWTRQITLDRTLSPVQPAEVEVDTVRLARVSVAVRWGGSRRIEMATLRAWGVKP